MRETRYRGGARDRPVSRLPERTRDRGHSPRRRIVERRHSPARRIRGRDYAPPGRRSRSRSRGRDYSPRLTDRNRDYSPTEGIRNRDYSPRERTQKRGDLVPARNRIREYSPPVRTRDWENVPRARSRERRFSPDGQQQQGEYFHELQRSREGKDGGTDFAELQSARSSGYNGGDRDFGKSQSLRFPERDRGNVDILNRNYLPPARAWSREQSPPVRTQNWETSPRARSRERVVSPRGHQHSEPQGEYFHGLERSREGRDGGKDFAELQSGRPTGYGGGDRDYGQSQSLRFPDRDRDMGLLGENSRRLYDGLGPGYTTSTKYQLSHLYDEPRKSDALKGSIDYGTGGSRISSERENQGRQFMDLVDIKEAEKRRLYSLYESIPSDVAVRPRSSGIVDADGYLPPSRYMDNAQLKEEGIHFQDKLRSEKATLGGPATRELYTEKDSLNSMRYPMFENHMVSSSRPNAQPMVPGYRNGESANSYAEDHIPSRGVRMGSGKITEPYGLDDYGKAPGTGSSMDTEEQFNGSRRYSHSYFDRAERDGAYSYSDFQRSEVGGHHTVSGELYGKNVGLRDAYSHKDVARSSIELGKHEEYSHREHLGENKPWEYLPPQGQSIPDESRRALDKQKAVVDILDYGHNQLKYENKTYRGYDSTHARDFHEYELDDPISLQERSDTFYTARVPHLENNDIYSRERYVSRDWPEPSSLRGKRGIDKSLSNRGYGITISSDGSERKIHGHRDTGETSMYGDTDFAIPSNKLNVTSSKYGKIGRVFNRAPIDRSRGSLSVSMSSRLSKFSKSGGRDIKKRLGPSSRSLDIAHAIGKKYRPSLKKRLGPHPVKNHVPVPWQKRINSYKLSRDQDGVDKTVAKQGDGPSEGVSTPAKTEPPENSKDFKQLVYNAFVKFVRQLNDTPARRRKYTKAGSLKCMVCGRDSEEFADSESLVLHALTCPKTGVRSQHLGLHKALCALLGWRSAEAPSSDWVREMLSAAETSALKQDLIIWPPVVIIHNSSIMNSDPGQRLVVSVEEIESKLKDMGFGDKGKVSRGKPADQSILVVKFSATLSGLQEAERLGNTYAESKHGRSEFQHISSGQVGTSDGKTQATLSDKVENVLYGYLGIAEDLDKLDFEIKKRSAVRSKKQIKDIAVAP